MYHLTDCRVDGKYIIGKNGFKEIVRVEKDAVKAVKSDEAKKQN